MNMREVAQKSQSQRDDVLKQKKREKSIQTQCLV